MALTSAQKRYLRAMAHGLKPVVSVGQQGVSPGVVAELDAALERHELVKVKISAGGQAVRREQCVSELCASTQAELVQRIGHVAVLYRPARKTPKLALP